MWHKRCDEMKTRKLLFNDRMKLFPNQKPVQDLTEDDYIFFAEAWANLQEQRCNPSKTANAPHLYRRPTKNARCEHTAGLDGQHPAPMQTRSGDNTGFATAEDLYYKPSAANQKIPQKVDTQTRTTPLGTTPSAPHTSRPRLPLFRTPDTRFKDLLQRSNMIGDGNCLFRALLRALDLNDNHHTDLRQKCVSHITTRWNRYEKYCNLIHSDSPDFPPFTTRPFIRASDYVAYMLRNGKWGSDLEALAAAEIYQVPVLIWSNRSKAHGFLMNHGVHTSNKGAIHVLHSGNHYDALIPHCKVSNCHQINRLASHIASQPDNERPTTLILDSPNLKPLQQKKQKLNHENETKPTRSNPCHNTNEHEEKIEAVRLPCPDKTETKQKSNIQCNQPEESTTYPPHTAAIPGLQRPCVLPSGKRRLSTYMIEIAQRAATNKRLKTKSFGHASYIIPRPQRRYGTSAINTKRKRCHQA
jgi:hypothetical protein